MVYIINIWYMNISRTKRNEVNFKREKYMEQLSCVRALRGIVLRSCHLVDAILNSDSFIVVQFFVILKPVGQQKEVTPAP